MDKYFNLGKYSRPISTRSAEAQRWFDRGLNWSYAFTHEEALRCYEKVIEADPDCPMGYWGVAYAAGPYYNMTWLEYSPQGLVDEMARTYRYTQEALKRAASGTPAERALIEAFAVRFPTADVPPESEREATFAVWDDAYAAAMRQAFARFKDDPDVVALAAEALMLRTPWLLWDLEKRTAAEGADTLEALEILEFGFEQRKAADLDPHPGQLHFYIHNREMSHEPEKALEASDQLMRLVPDAAHLVHMPSHIYILCGKYQEALDSNVLAVVADEKYVAYRPEISIYTIYYLHNLHFQVYAALFLGQEAAARKAALEMARVVTPESLGGDHQYLINYLEGYSGMLVHVLIRFGKWEEIIVAPLPSHPDLYCVTTAYWHYAKGVAYAASGDVAGAELEQTRFWEAVERVPPTRRVFNNECREVLKVAGAMLAGELEYRRENYDEAFNHLRRTVALYDQLNYTEPWAWMQPPRHALGALLLEQGHVEEAAAVYRADLGLDDSLVRPSQHVDNIWSLHGYVECLEALNRPEEAARFRRKLDVAQTNADVTVESSCFCRQSGHCCD
ncbi:MAG: hypothetical protein AAF633_05260 [Chloroflexota bacterium]